MQERIPRTVVHYALFDPRERTGGVETFARNLELVFERVLYMTPKTRDEALVRRERLPVVCDNQHVLTWPEDIPVIGFQHGVAARKVLSTGNRFDLRLALAQRRAARRPRVLWVACARWISDAFARLHGTPASHVVYHAVDLERFDGRRTGQGSRLVLHDARTPHKGKAAVERLARALPEYRFEPLACPPAEVPDRMRQALAFVHLSRYEGNSVVCNEAMAMDLPCLVTRVGLFLDDPPVEVRVLPARWAFFPGRSLVAAARAFLAEAERDAFHPRAWCLANTSHPANRAAWARVVQDFDARFLW